MPSYGKVKLEGVAELKRALEQLGPIVATKVGAAATRAAALQLLPIVISIAPYASGERKKYWRLKSGDVRSRHYGHLRDNLKVRKVKARKEYTITYNVTSGKAFWGNFLEFGTKNMPAQPFMRPAFDASVRLMQDAQIAGLRTGIEREAKKAARLKRRSGK